MEGRVELHEENVAGVWEWEVTQALTWGSIPTITRKAEVMASTVTFLEDVPVTISTATTSYPWTVFFWDLAP